LQGPDFQTLADAIRRCVPADRPALRRRLHRLRGIPNPPRGALEGLERDIEASRTRLQRRRQDRPQTDYPANLPIVVKKDEITAAIRARQVTIVCGETGSGKTTQLPKMCLDAGHGVGGLIGHTQPRRLAARAVAQRIAHELGTPLGTAVGYKVRFGDRTHEDGYIKLMTDGILLAEIQSDRLLRRYDTLIIDEAHERSLNIDFLLGYLKRILPKRPELRLIITSATIDPEGFSRHFDDAPIIEVSGRGYPVALRYRPLASDENDRDLEQGIVEAVDELERLGAGDTLVFLPGERDIRDTAEALRKHHPKGTEVLALYARLSGAEQDRIFQPHRGRRVVLATNAAETSLTVPGIRYVIDSGLVRISRYSVRSKVQRLPIEPISQASARQRAGRCGRTGPGTCIRLYSQEQHDARPPYTEPEIQRTNLAAVILQMSHLGLGEVDSFPFLSPPERRYINDGYRLLEELGVVDSGRRLTGLGHRLARLPVDPRLGRMILAAEPHCCLREVLIVVSALSVQDPRERPLERQGAADECHRAFRHPNSDFLTLVKLWDFIAEQQRHLSRNKLRTLYKGRFLSYLRIREWQDVHRQLRATVLAMGMAENTRPAGYGAVHRALLSGLLGHIGYWDGDGAYLGARNRRFHIFPGSGLAGRSPRWIMAAELTETHRLYARTVARIEPGWIEEAAPHLVKREYFEPHWQPRAARVGGFERVSLYGLVLTPRRRVDYGRIDPAAAREIFIREALVGGRYRTQAACLAHNRELIAQIQALEAKARRQDLLVGEEELFAFYAKQVPSEIHNGNAFERWLRDPQHHRRLHLTREQLMRHDGADLTEARFPHQIPLAGASLPLAYHFEPGEERDGVTVTVPLGLLRRLDPQHCEWLVPGLLQEKLVALIKALPKALRRNFVPAPDFASACVARLEPYASPLPEALSRALFRMTGVQVPVEAWRLAALPDHLRMRIRVVDAEGATLTTGRNVAALQGGLTRQAAAQFRSLDTDPHEREGITAWDFGRLDRTVEIRQDGVRIWAYPSLVAEGDGLALRLMDDPQKARAASEQGLIRLYQLTLGQQTRYLRKQLPNIQTLCLLYRGQGSCEVLKADLIDSVFRRVFLGDGEGPVDRRGFEARLERGRAKLITTASELTALVGTILGHHQALQRHLRGNAPLAWLEAIDDSKTQLQHLVFPGFIRTIPGEWLTQLPRYLKAMEQRLERLANAPEKDRRLRREIEPWWSRCLQRLDAGTEDPQFTRYRWMVEEYRVSLFAQSLGTAMPVSAQRLERQWDKVGGR
jgi:ATP-dependent helicase HrpA